MEKKDIKLAPGRFQVAESARQVWTATIEAGADPSALENPAFWSLIASRLSPYDKIEVRADDGAYYAEFLVLGCDRTWAKLQMLFEATLTTADVAQTQAAMQEPPSPDYLVRWGGPLKKWRVVRVADQVAVRDGELTRATAETWLANHRKVVA